MMEARDKQFKDLMTSYQPEKAPVNFAKLVMEQVHEQPVRTVYKPVFGKWFLRTVGALFAGFIIYSTFLTNPSGESARSELIRSLFSRVPKADLTGFAEAGKSVAGWLNQVPSVVAFALLAATLLLLLDWFLHRKYRSSTL